MGFHSSHILSDISDISLTTDVYCKNCGGTDAEVFKLTEPCGAIGYHRREIKKGEIGELSKIQEELDELKDAEEQGVKIMTLVELSDLYGAIEAYLETKHPEVSFDDLRKMSEVTRRAFRNGRRQ